MQHRLYVGPEGIVGRWGSSRVRPADSCFVHLLDAKEADRAVRARADGKPPLDDKRSVPLSAAGLAHVLAHEDDALLLHAAASGFRRFLDLWLFQSEGSTPTLLGPSLWPSQDRYAEAASEHAWVYYLKARQLGCSELECAFDGWRSRFGPTAARVHLFSLRDDEAKELLEVVRFGLDQLPEWLRLPVVRETTSRVQYQAAPDDRRLVVAYPSSKTTSRSSTATHAHVDEWAVMGDPQRVMQSIEPTLAPGGTFHVLTTALGPEDAASEYWRRCVAGDGAHAPVFVSALERPERTPEWLADKQRSMPRSSFDREYPTTPEQALSGGGETFFEDEDLDASGVDAAGLQPYRKGRRYLVSVDVGRTRDATVILVLDHSEPIIDVVYGRRLVNVPTPEQQRVIEQVADAYRAPVVVEDNSLGVALRENLDLPTDRVHGFTTTGRSKPVILDKLYVRLREQCVKFPHDDLPWLASELRGYVIPDQHVTQDAVMSLAIGVAACEDAEITHRGGRVLQVFNV